MVPSSHVEGVWMVTNSVRLCVAVIEGESAIRGKLSRLQSILFGSLAIFNRSRSQSGKPLLEVWHCPSLGHPGTL
jgi:hypothetical protein